MSAGSQATAAKTTAAASRPRPVHTAAASPAFGGVPATGVAALGALHAAAGNGAVTQLLGGGAPLADDVRSEMEARFGESFADVRIHDDAAAHRSSDALDANAYTVGNRIAFSAGRYAPQAGEGKRLIAHELAHVVQQRRGGAAPALSSDAPHEHGADAAAQAYASGQGAVVVQGSTGVGVARDEKKKHDDKFYQDAINGNRYFFWKGAKDWPVDPALKKLWDALPFTRENQAEGKGAEHASNVMKRPEFIEFADTVYEFQKQNSGLKATGVVDPPTADKLRAREAARQAKLEAERRAAQDKEAAEKAAKERAKPKLIQGTISASASGVAKGKASVGSWSLPGTDDLLRAAADPQGALTSITKTAIGAVGDLGIDKVKAKIAEFVVKQMGLSSAGTRIAAAIGRGVADQLVEELVNQGKGAELLKHLKEFSIGDAPTFLKGYYIGLVEGLVSPVTDLFGLAVFGESMSNLMKDFLASALTNRNKVSKELQEVIDAIGGAAKGVGELWQKIRDDPGKALTTFLNAPEVLAHIAEEKAYELGKSGGSAIVAGLEEPWKPKPKEEKPAPDPVKSPAAYIEHMAKGAEEYVIDTPWAKVGNKVGYAIGWVAIQAILIAFTDGIGSAVAGVGKALGSIGGVLGKFSKALGNAAKVVAELVVELGKGIGLVEKGILKAVDFVIEKLPFLKTALEPLGNLFTKLRNFLRKLLGAAEEEGVAIFESAAGKAVGAVDETPKVVPKKLPPADPPSNVTPFQRDVKPPVSDKSKTLASNLERQDPANAGTVTKLEPKGNPPPSNPNVAAKPQVVEEELPVVRQKASGDYEGLPADSNAPRASAGKRGGGGTKPQAGSGSSSTSSTSSASSTRTGTSPARGNLPAPLRRSSLSNPRAPLADRLAFVRRNRKLLDPKMRAQFDALNGKNPSANQLKTWEARIDQQVKAPYNEQVAAATGAKPGNVSSAKRPQGGPRSGGTEFEETHAGVRGEPQNDVTSTIRTDTDEAQFDSLGRPGGKVDPTEVKAYDRPPTEYEPPRWLPTDSYEQIVANNRQAAKGLEKALAREEERLWKAHDFADQMERQARIARDLKWPPVKWPMHSQAVEDYFTSEVLPLVPRELRQKIRLVREFFFD